MIKALLFDMDGVLADSEDLSIAIGIDYFNTLDIKASADDFAQHLGCGEIEFFDGTAHDLNASGYSYQEASSFFREHYEKAINDVNIALNGGARLIEMAKRAGLMTAVASSAPEWKVYANIKAIGLSPESFDAVITGRDIKRNKPFPDIYQLALIKLGIAAEEAVVFEDSKGGIKAGLDAHCFTVVLTTTLSYSDAEKTGADAIISDLGAIEQFSTAEELEKTLNAYAGISENAVLYGANYIAPLSRRMPYSFILEHAIESAKRAQNCAYAPYSGYKIGAAILSSASGRIYSGCNVENSSYGATICAERNAIFSAVAAEGAIGIDLLVVASDDDPPAPPCAACLQVIAEFAKPDTRVVLVSKNDRREYLFSDLLPHPFIFPSMRK